MAKLTLNDLVNLQNENTAVLTINDNNAAIETALENTLSRDGTSPNQMLSELDMNSNQIINLPTPATANSALRLADLNSFVGGGTVTNIPIGGVTGAPLIKSSNSNYAVTWGSGPIGYLAANNTWSGFNTWGPTGWAFINTDITVTGGRGAALVLSPTILTGGGNDGGQQLGILSISSVASGRYTAASYLNGIFVNLGTDNAGPNQNTAVLGFMQSRGGADPFGADLHGILPADATVAPAYVIGVQATAQLDHASLVPAVAAWPLVVTASSATGKKVTAMVQISGPGGSRFILATDTAVMTNEGIVLRPSDDLNPTYRAFAISNAANTRDNFNVTKSGASLFRDLMAVNRNAGTVSIIPANLALTVVEADSTAPILAQFGFGTGAAPGFRGYFSRNTGASPQAVQSGDILVAFQGFGFNAAAFTTSNARITMEAIETFSISQSGTRMVFETTPSGSITRASVLWLHGSGGLSQSSTDPGSGIFNALTGFRIANAATSGNVLRGNGTNFISAQLATTDLTGLGTGVASALAINVGSAGAFITFNGAFGTPSSGTLTNATGLPTTGLTGTLQAAQEPAHTGDVTNSAGSLALTLASVITAGGPTGSTTVVPIITYDVKGRLTAVTTATITPAVGSITGLGTGVATALAVNIGTAGSPIINGGALGSPSSAGTLPAHTLGGTIAGSGNQINNVVIGTSTPLAGFFTMLSASTSLTSPLHVGGSGTTGTQLTFQTTSGSGTTDAFAWNRGSNGATLAMTLNNTGLGIGAVAPDTLVTINANTGTTVTPTNTTQLHIIAADGAPATLAFDAFAAQSIIAIRRSNGTLASKTTINSADTLFAFSIQGYDGSAYGNAGGIQMLAVNGWTGSDHSSVITFRTVPTSSTSVAEAGRFNPSGGLSVGTTSDPGLGMIYTNAATYMIRTKTSYTNGAGVAAGTLLTAPTAGNPTKWIPIDDNGTTRYIPAW